jgi:DNA repair photolyase
MSPRHRKDRGWSGLTGDGDVLALNLARGCAHRCAFCSVRAYPTYPGDGVVQLFAGTAERLERELSGRRRLPRAVFVSPSTDPFPPIRVVQNEAVRVVEVLARNGVEAWLMTRGALMVETLDALAVHAARVKVTVGVTTLDQRLQRVLEPLAALPRERVRQVAELQRLGVRVQVGVEPLLPGLTDTRENLEPLLAALAGAGVRHVTASYAFLRPGIAENLATTLDANGLDGTLPTAYERGPMLEGNGLSPARYLPKARRQRGYAALMALAANHGITVSVCGTTNPDFAPPRAPEGSAGRPSLLTQFLQASGALGTVV